MYVLKRTGTQYRVRAKLLYLAFLTPSTLRYIHRTCECLLQASPEPHPLLWKHLMRNEAQQRERECHTDPDRRLSSATLLTPATEASRFQWMNKRSRVHTHAYLLRPPKHGTVSLSMLKQHSRSLFLDEPLPWRSLDLDLLSALSCRCFLLRGSSISPSSRSSSESDSESTRRRRYCFFMSLLVLSRCNGKVWESNVSHGTGAGAAVRGRGQNTRAE